MWEKVDITHNPVEYRYQYSLPFGAISAPGGGDTWEGPE